MTDGVDIGGRSRRFQAAVIVVTMLALLAGALAAATLDSTSPLDLDINPGDGGVDGGEGSVAGDTGGGDGGGGDGGGIGLPEFILDIIDGIIDGDGSGEEDPRPVDPGEGRLPPPPYNITLDPTPTPGLPVVVTVEKNNSPVPFVSVAFDGERVGRTGPTGQLRARVPYTDELTVTASPPPEADDGPDGSPTGAGEPLAITGPGDSSGPGGVGGLAVPTGSGGPGALGTGPQAGERDGSSDTYELPTNVTARVDGVALPGESAAVQFTIAGNPVPGVEVRHSGQRVGLTGDNGTADIPIPADIPLAGSVPVVLARGEFAGEATVEVGDVVADVETGLLALPATGATVELTAVDSTDTEPLGGVPVVVTDGGEQVAAGQTGENGTMSFTLPWTDSVTATGTTTSGTVSAMVSGIVLQLAGLVVALALVLVGLVVRTRQSPATRRRGRERLVWLLLAAAGLLERAGRRFARAVRSLPARGVWLWGGLVRVAGWLWGRMVAGAGLQRGGLVAAVRRLRGVAWLAGPRWLLRRFRAGVLWPIGLLSTSGGEETVTAEQTQSGARAEASTEPQSADQRLRQCWQWLVRRVAGHGGLRTETPMEIERRAVEQGLPAGPVRRLRRAFQDVEYGPAAAAERVDDARSARERLDGEEDSETDA